MTLALTGTRDPAAGKVGGPWKKIRDDLDGFTLADFHATDWGDAFLTIGAATVTNLDLGPGTIDRTYRVLNMGEPAGQLHGFRIHDITATNLERGGLRFKDASDGLIEDVTCLSDGLGCPDIPVGFAITDGPGHHITYRRCTAGGFVKRVDRPGAYVNGDGFSDEETCTDITYEDCYAHDNGDGGLDSKCANLVATRVTCERNKRNFRLWGSGVVTDCVSIDPAQVHFWFGGQNRPGSYLLERPVFVGGQGLPHIRVDAGMVGDVITVVDPVLPAGETLRVEQNGSGELVTVRVIATPAPEPRTLPVQIVVDGATYAGTLTEQ